MSSRRLSPFATILVAASLFIAAGAIAGAPEGVENGVESSAAPNAPVIAAGPTDPTTDTTATFWFSAKGPKTGFECRLDANDFVSCSSPAVYSDLAVGVHAFEVVTVNRSLRSAPAHYVWTIESPPTPPPATPTIDSGPPSVTTKTEATFEFSSTSVGVSFLCRLDGGLWVACASPKRYTELAVGRHLFEVKARNGAGMDSGVASMTWKVEAPPPPATTCLSDLAWVSMENGWGPAERDTSNGEKAAGDGSTLALDRATYAKGLGVHARSDIRFSVTGCSRFKTAVGVDDEVGSNGSVTFEVYAGSTRVFDSGLMTGATSTKLVDVSIAGASELRLVVTNGGDTIANDHADWALARVECSPDTNPPPPPPPPDPPTTPTIDSGPPSVTTETDATFSFSSATADVSFSCRLDDAPWDGCASPKTYTGLALGQHRFAVKAQDGAGQESGIASMTWTIEATQPPPDPPATPTIDSGPPSTTTETEATFTFSSATVGVSFLCRLDAASWATCVSPKHYTGLSVGEHKFDVKAQDAAGQESGVASRTWTIEIPPPTPTPPPPPGGSNPGAPTLPPATPTIDSGPSSVTSQTSATFSFSSTSGAVTYQCRLDGASWSSCASPKTYTGLASSSHQFEVKARNGSGQESGVASRTWVVDTAEPTASITSPAAGSKLSGTVVVSAVASDNVRVERVEFKVGGTLAATSTTAPHTFSWDTTKSADGQYTVEVRSFDTAGNASAPASRSYTVANQAPPPGSCSGVQIAPGSSIQVAVDASPQGSTFCLRAGVHRVMQAVVPKPGSTFVGEPGTIVSGARDLAGLFTQTGSAWFASGMTYEGQGDPGWPNPCENGGTLCLRTNDVYYDDRLLERVGSLGELSSGKFYFDYGADRIYIADSPVGHRVEVGVGPGAFRSWGTGAINVTLRGFVVEKFASPASTPAIQGNDGWILEDMTVRLNHSIGVNGFQVFRNGLVHDNGQAGVSTADGTGQTVEGSEFYSNHRVPIICWHGGAVKILRSQNAIIRNNYAHDDSCMGLWADWDNIGTLYEGNRVERIAGPGIFHEASFDAVIRNNTVRDSGFGPDVTGWIDGSGILVNSSRNVEIYGNTVEGNRHGIGATYTNRGSSATYGLREVTNLRVHHNTIRVTWRAPSGSWSTAAGVAGIITQPFTSQAFYNNNTYATCTATEYSGPNPAGSTTYGAMRWSDWRAQGQDPNSSNSSSC